MILFFSISCSENDDDEDNLSSPHQLYTFNDNLAPRWSSFENITAEKGAGGMENNGAKGHP